MVKNLSHDETKQILVTNICKSAIVNDFAKNYHSKNITNALYLDPDSKLFLSIIPNNSKIFIGLFCCNINMEKIHSKFGDYGLALEGCFNIEPITMLPSFYQGYDYLSVTNNITSTFKNGNAKDLNILNMKSPIIPKEQAFLVIDNHSIISITDAIGLKAYQPKGVNVQYVEGKFLFKNGKPFVDFNMIKNIKIINDNGTEIIVDGSNVTIDYYSLKIKVNNVFYDFSDIGQKINFVNSDFFNLDNGLLIFGIDKKNNIFVVYHKYIDFYNILLLLELFDSRDAILLCNSTSANIIWKERGFNMYNKTDFIGNPKKMLSNVITFSG
jgi:hypothetical protein